MSAHTLPLAPLDDRSAWRFGVFAGAVLLIAGVHLSASGLSVGWMRALHQGPASHWPGLWAGLSVLGLGWAGAIVLCALDRPGNGRLLAPMLLLLPVASLLIQLSKRLLSVPRPAAVLGDELQVVGERLLGSSSMPSGHSMTAAAVCLLIVMGLTLAWYWRLLAVAVAAGVLWSRMRVGAHWPADVLVGGGLGVWLAVGAVWLCREVPGLARWAQRLGQGPAQRRVVWGEVGLALGLLLTPTGYPQAKPVQWALVVLALGSAALRWRAVTRPAA